MKKPRETTQKPQKIIRELSPLINDLLYFPRGIPARITNTGFLTTMFDCTCDTHHCLITKFSTVLMRSLDMVSAKFDQPITIVTGFNCMKPSFGKGQALQLQSSANDQLLAIWERLYPEYKYEQDDQTITIRKQ